MQPHMTNSHLRGAQLCRRHPIALMCRAARRWGLLGNVRVQFLGILPADGEMFTAICRQLGLFHGSRSLDEHMNRAKQFRLVQAMR